MYQVFSCFSRQRGWCGDLFELRGSSLLEAVGKGLNAFSQGVFGLEQRGKVGVNFLVQSGFFSNLMMF